MRKTGYVVWKTATVCHCEKTKFFNPMKFLVTTVERDEMSIGLRVHGTQGKWIMLIKAS